MSIYINFQFCYYSTPHFGHLSFLASGKSKIDITIMSEENYLGYTYVSQIIYALNKS